MRRRARGFVTAIFSTPLLRRIGYHVKSMTRNVDRTFFIRLFAGLFFVVMVAALLVTAIEGPRDSVGAFFGKLGDSFYWGVTTVMGAGDASYVTSPVGYVISWLLVLFGVAIVATITGALVGFLIDFLLKEGQGMGASGYRDHIVVCGWNSTARELIAELDGDDYDTQDRADPRQRTRTPRAAASTSSTATSPTLTTSSGPASRRRWPPWSARRTPPTRPTCARSSP